MKHVAAFREHLADTARRLRRVAAPLRAAVIMARDAAGRARRRCSRHCRHYLERFQSPAIRRHLKQRQAAVDSADEYARVNGACGGLRMRNDPVRRVRQS